MAHPQLEDIVHRRHVTGKAPECIADVAVRINEARQHITTVGIDLKFSGGWARLSTDWHTRVANRPNFSDAIAFNHNIHRANGRCTGAIDDCCTSDHQPVVGPLADACFTRAGNKGEFGDGA